MRRGHRGGEQVAVARPFRRLAAAMATNVTLQIYDRESDPLTAGLTRGRGNRTRARAAICATRPAQRDERAHERPSRSPSMPTTHATNTSERPSGAQGELRAGPDRRAHTSFCRPADDFCMLVGVMASASSSLHPAVADVTARVATRSEHTRAAYLERIAAAAAAGPARGALGCANLAHGVAACGARGAARCCARAARRTSRSSPPTTTCCRRTSRSRPTRRRCGGP